MQPKLDQPPKLLNEVRTRLRAKHYSYNTEKTYYDWINRFIIYHDQRHPNTMGAVEIQAFLNHLAVTANLSAATQNQALSALLFLYREVLAIQLPTLTITWAKKASHIPVVLSPAEVQQLFQHLGGPKSRNSQNGWRSQSA